MGYYMSNIGCDFTIKKENKQKALDLLKQLDKQRNLNWIIKGAITKAETLSEAFEKCGWTIEEDDDGEVISIYFDGEKLGDEDAIFSAIASAVENDSYIEMGGEEGDRWRWWFRDGICKVVNAKIIWEWNE